MWGLDEWKGSLYPAGTSSRRYLELYARVWDTVEGNTTFYSLPSEASVTRWREAVPADFRFCFKLPREVTHDALLGPAARKPLRRFLERMEPLRDRCGPFMIQLPAAFRRASLPRLTSLLDDLPRDLAFTVEVRDPDFLTPEGLEKLGGTLEPRGVGRVIFDSTPLWSGDPEHPAVRNARHEKPRLPLVPSALGDRPVVRWIAHPDSPATEASIRAWADRLSTWCREGRRPLFFVHCPDNGRAPALARRLRESLLDRGIGDGPRPWPGETATATGQRLLFPPELGR